MRAVAAWKDGVYILMAPHTEVRALVPLGDLDPDAIHTACIFVDWMAQCAPHQGERISLR